jgi:hypothetical protein
MQYIILACWILIYLLGVYSHCITIGLAVPYQLYNSYEVTLFYNMALHTQSFAVR